MALYCVEHSSSLLLSDGNAALQTVCFTNTGKTGGAEPVCFWRTRFEMMLLISSCVMRVTPLIKEPYITRVFILALCHSQGKEWRRPRDNKNRKCTLVAATNPYSESAVTAAVGWLKRSQCNLSALTCIASPSMFWLSLHFTGMWWLSEDHSATVAVDMTVGTLLFSLQTSLESN